MDRSIPVGNRICTQRADQRNYEVHRAKLRRSKSFIDTSVPVSSTFNHVRANWKREQLAEDRFIDIDKANRCLLDRMKEIDTRPVVKSGKVAIVPKVTSLNKGYRRRELERITMENSGVASRIDSVPAIYPHTRLERDFRQSRKYMQNKCSLPVVLESSLIGKKAGVESPCQTPALESPPVAPLAIVSRELGDTNCTIQVRGTWDGGLQVVATRADESVVSELVLSKETHVDLMTSGRSYKDIAMEVELLGNELRLPESKNSSS